MDIDVAIRKRHPLSRPIVLIKTTLGLGGA
jgi:hypothetical protein